MGDCRMWREPMADLLVLLDHLRRGGLLFTGSTCIPYASRNQGIDCFIYSTWF